MPPSRSPALIVVPALDTHRGLRSTPLPVQAASRPGAWGAWLVRLLRSTWGSEAAEVRTLSKDAAGTKALLQTGVYIRARLLPSLSLSFPPRKTRGIDFLPRREGATSPAGPACMGPGPGLVSALLGPPKKTHSEALSPVSMPPGSTAWTPRALGWARLLAPPSWGTL